MLAVPPGTVKLRLLSIPAASVQFSSYTTGAIKTNNEWHAG